MAMPRVPMHARFWAKVDKTQDCWRWTGATRRHRQWAYGVIQADAPSRKLLQAHRVSLEMTLGRALRPEERACHRCDNTLCVRPGHLFVGSARDNTQDMIHKRRHPTFVLTAGQARDIRARYARGGVSQTDLAHEYGVTPSCVNKIVRGTRQREVA